MFLIGPDGEVRGRYDKERLLPFSEFFPLRSVELLRRRFERVQHFVHGAPGPPLQTRVGAAGVMICNEAMQPELAAARVDAGADYLLSPSNDSWIARRNWAEMIFALVSVRAIEQRRYLLRASTSGPSGIVDPWGRVRVRSEPLSRAVLVGWLRPETGRSVYGVVGDAFGLACAAGVAALLLGTRSRAAAPGATESGSQ